jgi:hypothetical protein
MRTFIYKAIERGRQHRGPRLAAGVAVLTAAALAGGLVVTAGPAFADITSGEYTIGAPSGAVTDVTASPSATGEGVSTSFSVTFIASTALSGGSDGSVTVTPSTPLGSTPSSIDLVGGGCIQAGTSGAGGAGSASATGVTIELGASCGVSSGAKVEVDFTADAPTSPGNFDFAATTSQNGTAATSNDVTVGASGATLTANTYALGANTTYSIVDVPVAGLSGAGTSLSLTSAPTQGTETIAFLNSATGYSVTYTPSGGAATADTVTGASSVGATVTLTLTTALVSGDTVNIVATGTNPSPTAITQADKVTVVPGNGTPEVTNSIVFGSSVSDAVVSPSSLVAGASANYVIDFRATSAVSPGGDIYLDETSGPTNFSTVSGIEVSDVTQNWHFVATGAILSSGNAIIPLADAVVAGDSISVLVVSVTNPITAQTISDFGVATTGDPVAADAVGYSIGPNGSPGVVVTVSPDSPGALATYTISSIHASAALSGGTSTIKLESPSGTVFPNNPSFYSVVDSTTPSGSGTVTAALSGGGTNTVTFTVPNTVNSGDALNVSVEDVVNPSAASGTYTITLVGSVTGPTPTAVTTTTTTTAPTTTTTKPKPPAPKPVVSDLTAKATVSKTKAHVVDIKLQCKVLRCTGVVTLTDVRTQVGSAKYRVVAGKETTAIIGISTKGLSYIHGAKGHTIKVTAKVTVTGGKTVTRKTELNG